MFIEIEVLVCLPSRALSRFEEGDFEECRAQLELLPGEDYGLLNSTTKDKIGMIIAHTIHGHGKKENLLGIIIIVVIISSIIFSL